MTDKLINAMNTYARLWDVYLWTSRWGSGELRLTILGNIQIMSKHLSEFILKELNNEPVQQSAGEQDGS